MEKSIGEIWSLNTDTIEPTNICEEGIPHTNRSVVTILNIFDREYSRLDIENKRLKLEINGLKLALKDIKNIAMELDLDE